MGAFSAIRSRKLALIAGLILVVVLGGALRADAAAHPTPFQSRDEQAYAMIARGLVDHGTYGNPAMRDPLHWPPGAPLEFAAVDRLHRTTVPVVDKRPRWDIPGAYWVQAALGTSTIIAAFVLALLLAGPLAGMAAAVVVAFYPPLIATSSDLLSEPLGALLATSALATVVAAAWRPSLLSWRGLLAGLLLAATVLTRSDLALLPVIGTLAVAVAAARAASGRWWQRGRASAAAAVPIIVGAFVLLAPWSALASRHAGHRVLLSTGGGSNLFVGTLLPGHGTLFGSKRVLAAETMRHFPRTVGLRPANLPETLVMRAVAARRPNLTVDAALSAAAHANLREYALGRPAAFGRMMLSKVGRLWLHYSIGTHRHPREWVTVLHLFVVFCSAIGLFAGLAVGRRWALLLPAACLVYVTALNSVLISEPRHNLTLMPTLVCAGAAGVASAAGRRRGDRVDHSPAAAAAGQREPGAGQA